MPFSITGSPTHTSLCALPSSQPADAHALTPNHQRPPHTQPLMPMFSHLTISAHDFAPRFQCPPHRQPSMLVLLYSTIIAHASHLPIAVYIRPQSQALRSPHPAATHFQPERTPHFLHTLFQQQQQQLQNLTGLYLSMSIPPPECIPIIAQWYPTTSMRAHN
mmetsp:Transcript_10099/g.26221  ORF Transcript_10099/g.26221 Transcript_10099/m.26221 type:complete len:162 (-) Transcript_10099:2257-2742(-)